MQALARFIMEGKIPAELWVFLASLFLAFNGQIYTYLYGGEDFSLALPLILNFVVFLLAGAPLAIGILRFTYVRTLAFVLALVLPMLMAGNFNLLKFFAGVIIFAYLLRIVRNLGISLVITALALIPLTSSIQWMSAQEKDNVARSVLSLRIQAQVDDSKKFADEQLKEKFKDEQVEAFISIMDASMTTTLVIFNMLLVLFARWLQSLLYYPGGFRQEFLNLKINFWFAIGTLIAGVVIFYSLESALKYIVIMLIPYFFVGLSLAHTLVEKKELGKGMLIGFYIGLFLFAQVLTLFLILVGFLDSLVDFRKRFNS